MSLALRGVPPSRDRVAAALRSFARRPLDRPDLKAAAVGITLVDDGGAYC